MHAVLDSWARISDHLRALSSTSRFKEVEAMHFTSTADPSIQVNASEAMSRGLAPNGRLFVPSAFPQFSPEDFDGLDTIAEIGARLLRPFFEGDPLQDRLLEICEEAFDFDIPLVELTEDTSVLELFHGPTAAFKDIGARFLASSLSRINEGHERPLTILVATSGDTGGAVAAAFHGKPNVEVFILYPKGRVSHRQERQLTCWEGNITTFAVNGFFDDCQKMVKSAFAHDWWKENKRLSSANSINIGRLLPQMVYYAASSLWHWRKHGEAPSYIVPSGNVGNMCACVWARECGLPIDQLILATNANATLHEYFQTGSWAPRPTVETIANAMDVGNPSNMERLRHLWPDLEQMREHLRVEQVLDPQIRTQIKLGERVWGEVWCPHTACAVQVREGIADERHWIMVATAHPAKFDVIVEPLVGRPVEVPEELAKLLEKPNLSIDIDADLGALTDAVAERSRGIPS